MESEAFVSLFSYARHWSLSGASLGHATHCFFQIPFNIVFSFVPKSPKQSLLWMFSKPKFHLICPCLLHAVQKVISSHWPLRNCSRNWCYIRAAASLKMANKLFWRKYENLPRFDHFNCELSFPVTVGFMTFVHTF